MANIRDSLHELGTALRSRYHAGNPVLWNVTGARPSILINNYDPLVFVKYEVGKSPPPIITGKLAVVGLTAIVSAQPEDDAIYRPRVVTEINETMYGFNVDHLTLNSLAAALQKPHCMFTTA